MSEPLSGSSVFRTGDLDVIREVGSQVLVPHRVEAFGPVSPTACMNAAKLGSTTVAYMRYESHVTLAAPTCASTYFFTVPLTGRAEAGRGSSEVAPLGASQGAAYRADDPGLLTLRPDYSMLFVRVERPALERQLEWLLGIEVTVPLCFDFGMDLASPGLRSWVDSVGLLRAELERNGGETAHPLLSGRLQDLVMTALLTGQPHNYSEYLNTAHQPARPRTVKQAIDLMEQQPEQPWSLADLARATGISARTLQDGFQRYVGLSPTSYLREVRLQRVHAELLGATGRVSVSESAFRWGFGHLGRFSLAYRGKFGESPSQTVRRCGAEVIGSGQEVLDGPVRI